MHEQFKTPKIKRAVFSELSNVQNKPFNNFLPIFRTYRTQPTLQGLHGGSELLARGGGIADFDGLLPRSFGGGEGLREQGGGETALWMAKEMDSTLHSRFTIFTASWKYSKWTNPSGANPTIVAGTRTPLERV